MAATSGTCKDRAWKIGGWKAAASGDGEREADRPARVGRAGRVVGAAAGAADADLHRLDATADTGDAPGGAITHHNGRISHVLLHPARRGPSRLSVGDRG